jgi:hypothetical protein
MPVDPQAVAAAAEQAEQAMRTTAVRSIAAAVPPPVEPLDGGWLDTVRTALERTMGTLSGGHFPVTYEPVPKGPHPTVPMDLGASVVALSEAVKALPEPRLAAYKFDAREVLSSNDGLRHLLTVLSSMGQDKELARALQGGAPLPQPPVMR